MIFALSSARDFAFFATFRTSAETNSGRRKLAGPRVSQRRRRTVLRRACRRLENLGRRRKRIHRLRRQLGAGDPRSCSKSNCRCCPRGGRARPQLRNSESARSGNGGAHLPMDAVDRKGSNAEQRDGSDHVVPPSGAWFHEAGQGHQIRRLLSRARRCVAGEIGQWRAHSRTPG